MHVFQSTEIAAALLQAALTLGMAAVFLFLWSRDRKAHFLWWAVAWGLYALRLAAIITFLASDTWSWLYWHQVASGWVGLALLWGALVFSRQLPMRPAYLLVLLFPVVWSYIAIFELDHFMLAAGPAVAFLALTTLWTAWVFWQHRRRTGSTAALVLAITFGLWGLHHLDYPLLRARGAWNPWGYYLDSLLLLAVGTSFLLLMIEELRQGLGTLAALSGDLRRPVRGDSLDDLLQRPLALNGVRGAALFLAEEGRVPVRCVGDCAAWDGREVPAPIRALVDEALRTGAPILHSQPHAPAGAPPFAAVLPLGGTAPSAVLLIVGDAAAPFAALDESVLVAIGEQIGAALDSAELTRRLESRTADLERLSVRMIQQHEEQRQRLARELHDETAQVFSALKLQVGSLREEAPAELGPRLDKLLELVAAGRRSIRNVTEDLRPSLLDDLGLVPAIRALVSDFREWSGIAARFEAPATLPPLPTETELALFRTVQEGLSNVARHAQASAVEVRLATEAGGVRLVLEDNGAGVAPEDLARLGDGPGRSGLFGMRERLAAVGGTLAIAAPPGRGVCLEVTVPVQISSPAHD